MCTCLNILIIEGEFLCANKHSYKHTHKEKTKQIWGGGGILNKCRVKTKRPLKIKGKEKKKKMMMNSGRGHWEEIWISNEVYRHLGETCWKPRVHVYVEWVQSIEFMNIDE